MLEFKFSPFPTLETERLVLREINNDDLPALFNMRSSEIVMKYIDRPRPANMEELVPWLEKIKSGIAGNTDIAWAITLKGSPELIGQIGFWRNEPENHRGEVGYMLLPEYFGKGIASEAINTVCKYGFETIKFHSVKGCVDPANTASIRVLEKAGFKKEAHFRDDYFFNGVFGDTGIYCMLATDWERKNNAK